MILRPCSDAATPNSPALGAEHQRMGIASALLTQIEASALTLDLQRLFTEASITAKPFFAAMGFVVIVQQVVECRGVELINYRMERRIDCGD